MENQRADPLGQKSAAGSADQVPTLTVASGDFSIERL
jgi:hypothetical protein